MFQTVQPTRQTTKIAASAILTAVVITDFEKYVDPAAVTVIRPVCLTIVVNGNLVQFGVLSLGCGVKVKINGFRGFDVNSKLHSPHCAKPINHILPYDIKFNITLSSIKSGIELTFYPYYAGFCNDVRRFFHAVGLVTNFWRGHFL